MTISKRRIALWLPVFCTIAVYTNTFRNLFLWDDNLVIFQNQLIQDLRHLPGLFTTVFFLNPDSHKGDYYRPVIFLSFMFDYHFWGEHLLDII